MTEETNTSLYKKIEDQSRFTRAVVVICTAAVLAVNFITLTKMFTDLPTAMLANYMANLDKIVWQWSAIETRTLKRGGGATTELPSSKAPAK